MAQADKLVKLLATVGGVGNIPFASGTFGTIPAMVLVGALMVALPAAAVIMVLLRYAHQQYQQSGLYADS